MKVVSDESFLKLTKEDLQIKEYDVLSDFMRIILKCGLCVYWSGYNNLPEEAGYGRIIFDYWFRGSVKDLVIVEQSSDELLIEDSSSGCLPDFLSDYIDKNPINETDAKYPKIVEIIKNITKETKGEIYCLEFHDYMIEVKQQVDKELTEALIPYSSLIADIVKKSNKQKTENYKVCSQEELDKKNEL